MVSNTNGNVAAEAGSYEAMVSVVKQNLEMKIPHQGTVLVMSVDGETSLKNPIRDG